jgi:vacuole morphology and inheritance protein 14
MIQSAGVRTNKLLLNVVQALPSPTETQPKAPEKSSSSPLPTAVSPTPTANSLPTRQSIGKETVPAHDVTFPESAQETTATKPRSTLTVDQPLKPDVVPPIVPPSRPESPNSTASITVFGQNMQQSPLSPEKPYGLDYPATVNALTIQFLSDHEETRVAALKWLIMLHQKSPKILAMDDGTFPALLKTLSDSSEEAR